MTKRLLTRLLFLAMVLTGTSVLAQYNVDFESNTAGTNYSTTSVAINGINWSFTQALIGNLSGDFKNGNNSLRLRGYTGSVASMIQDKTNGLGTISFQYRRYGTDTGQVPYVVEYSSDAGSNWTQIGSAITATATVQTFTEAVNVAGSIRVRFRVVGTPGTSGDRRWNIDDIAMSNYAANTPTITTSTTGLTGFTYVAGSGPSSQQSFTVGGTNLTGNITVPASSSYEISTTSGSGFSSSAITLTPATGTVSTTTIYVRLKAGLTAATYNESITITSTGATDKSVSFSGSVTAPVISAALAGTLTETNLTAGTATATVTMTNDTYVTNLTTAGFTLNNAPTGLTLSSVDRTSATVATLHFAYTGDIDSNITNFSVTVATSQLTTSTSARSTGTITITAVNETLTPSPTSLTGFSYAVGSGPSVAQSFTLSSGNNLQAGGGTITITAPSNFEVSTTDAINGFGNSATLSYTGTGTISPNQAWVRLRSGLTIGSYSQTVTVAGGKATTSVTVSGTVVAPPPVNDNCSGATALTLDAAAISGTFQNATQSIAAIDCTGNTGNADDDVWYSFTTTDAADYTITVDGGADNDVIIDLRSGACNGTNIACMDDTAGNEEVLTHGLSANTTYYVRVYEYGALSSLVDYNFTIRVVKNLSVPVATAATDISPAAFTANWDAVNDATGYRIDVSTYSDFGSSQTTQGFESTTFPPTGWTASGWTRSTSSGDVSVGSAAAIGGSNSGSLTTAAIANPSTLTFNLGRSSNTTAKTLYVEVSTTSQSSGFATVATFNHSNVGSGSYSQYTIDLSSYSSNSTVYIRFRKESSTTSPWRLDEIVILSQLPMVAGFENRSVAGTSVNVTSLDQNTDYYYRVRAVNGSITSSNSNTIHTKTGRVNTWNGTAWSGGSAPTVIDDAVISGDFKTNLDGVFTAHDLTVATDSLIVAPMTSLTVKRKITIDSGAAMLIKSNGSVIQIDETAENSGQVNVERYSPSLKRLDYKLWSSPVTGITMAGFSPLTETNRFYRYNPQNNNYSQIATSTGFNVGQGYLIRMPNNHPSTATQWLGKFKGGLTTGAKSVTVESGYNAVGNPYASPIDADDFIAANSGNIDGTLYFWRKTNAAAAEAYVTYNSVMGGNNNGAEADEPNGIIAIGQGFIVNAISNNVVFNNAMRVSNFANQVYSTPERHRVWVNLTNNNGAYSQALVGYAAGATNGIDTAADSKYFGSGNSALYSVLNDGKYAIQGRALPFVNTDVIPMGYKAVEAGNFTIAIDHVDGLFTQGQVVYLKDNVTNTVHNLSDNNYNFTTEAGTFDGRFEIVFQNIALGTDVPVITAENVIVYKDGNSIKINAGTIELSDVTVYDMRGREVASQKGINASEAVITNITTEQQVLIVKINTVKNGSVSRKIIF